MGEERGWEVRARRCSRSKRVAMGCKERDRKRGGSGEGGREREANSRRVWYCGYEYFCLDLCVAHLGRPWPTSFHPLTLRSLPVCAWILE